MISPTAFHPSTLLRVEGITATLIFLNAHLSNHTRTLSALEDCRIRRTMYPDAAD